VKVHGASEVAPFKRLQEHHFHNFPGSGLGNQGGIQVSLDFSVRHQSLHFEINGDFHDVSFPDSQSPIARSGIANYCS